MFTTKQSDVFYNDQTREMFVCKVSSISGQRCQGSTDIVYGALPIVYKIDKNTNYQSVIYPKNLDTFKDDNRSDLFDLLPKNYYGDDTNFNSITKPLINYNKTSDRYSVTCIGRYTARADGFGILNYIFQYIDTDFYLLDTEAFLPNDKLGTNRFTFKSGYLNSDLIIGGNPLRWNEEIDTAYQERVTDYSLTPTHVDYNDSLGFNLMAYCRKGTGAGSSEKTCLTATKQSVFQYSGGYITYNPKYAAFDSNYDIRVDFTAKSFQVPTMTAYRSLQSNNSDSHPSRYIDIATTANFGLTGAGEGFCAYFYRNPADGIVEPMGVGSTLGYAKASTLATEIEENASSGRIPLSAGNVEGLIVNNSNMYGANYGAPADCFLGVGFDIRGDFCTTADGKEGWLSAGGGAGTWSHGKWSGNHTNKTAPSSVGIRGNRDSFTRVLTCMSISTVAASAVSMHQQSANATGSDVDFQDYRIDLTNKGTRVTIYNKLTSATDYNTIMEFDLNSVKDNKGSYYQPWSVGIDTPEALPSIGIGTTAVGIGTTYAPGVGVGSTAPVDVSNSGTYQSGKLEPAPLNVGLSFTTSNFSSHFELHSFKVTGVRMGRPTKAIEKIDNITTVEYLEESSANLRRDLVTIPTPDPIDITMLIKREKLLDRIDLCSVPEWKTTEIEAKWTAVNTRRNDIPGPPGDPNPVIVDPPKLRPPEECAGWFEPIFDTEGDTEGQRKGSGRTQYILGWNRISKSQLNSNAYNPAVNDMIREYEIDGISYLIQWETAAGSEEKTTQNITTTYIVDPKQTGYSSQPILVNDVKFINPRNFALTHYKATVSHKPVGKALGQDWVKIAVWLTAEQATAAGACKEATSGDEGEPVVIEPIRKIGHCWVKTWDQIDALLQEYNNLCVGDTPQACHDYIGYKSNLSEPTGDDDRTVYETYKHEYTRHKWGQLFGRVEYYSRDNLDSLVGLKEEVKKNFPDGITYFRKWGDRNWNGNIIWNQGRNCVTKKNAAGKDITISCDPEGCYIVRGNYLKHAMEASQPGGHGAAMWHAGDGSPERDNKYAYKDHSTGKTWTNKEAWEWRHDEEGRNKKIMGDADDSLHNALSESVEEKG